MKVFGNFIKFIENRNWYEIKSMNLDWISGKMFTKLNAYSHRIYVRLIYIYIFKVSERNFRVMDYGHLGIVFALIIIIHYLLKSHLLIHYLLYLIYHAPLIIYYLLYITHDTLFIIHHLSYITYYLPLIIHYLLYIIYHIPHTLIIYYS